MKSFFLLYLLGFFGPWGSPPAQTPPTCSARGELCALIQAAQCCLRDCDPESCTLAQTAQSCPKGCDPATCTLVQTGQTCPKGCDPQACVLVQTAQTGHSKDSADSHAAGTSCKPLCILKTACIKTSAAACGGVGLEL